MIAPPQVSLPHHSAAIVLCGGLGTRLSEVVPDVPKVLAPLGGKPFLEILLSRLEREGIARIILATGHLGDRIDGFIADRRNRAEILVSRETIPLGTGGAVKLAEPFMRGDTFFVFNGDCFCDFLLSDLLAFHNSRAGTVTIALAEAHDRGDYGKALMDPTGRILSFTEKSVGLSGPMNSGTYLFHRRVFALIPPRRKYSLETDLLPILNDAYGFDTKTRFIDIGTEQRYRLAQNMKW